MKTKSIIAAILLAASSAFAQVPSYVPTNGLVGWWPFNGNANDESGNGNNGTVNGATLTNDRFGTAGKAYQFNGNSNYIDIQNTFGLSSNQGLSMSLWFKWNGSNGLDNHQYLFLIANNPNSSITIGDNGSIVTNVVNCNCSNDIGVQTNITQNTWNNIVLTYELNQGLMKMYLNGIYINSSQENIFSYYTTNNSADRFGNYHFNSNYFNGQLDDAGLWNRALTQQEITALYNSQSCNSSSNTIAADGPTTFCAGNSVNLKSDIVGGTYQWRRNGVNITTNATSRTFKASTTGTYTCVATCNGTALTSNAIAVTSKTNASATVSASGATSFCAGDSVTLNATNLGSNYSVQWYRTNVSMENATNYSQVVKQPGTYKVVTRNLTNGCSRISGSAITTNVNCRTANNNQSEPTSNDINEEARTLAPELSQGVNLFPNPNNGSFKFTYEGEVEGEGTIQVISAMGQVIYQSQATAEDGRISKEIFLGDQYQKGIYIVRLLINGGQNDSRMIVQ
jgi:hypothetical protein